MNRLRRGNSRRDGAHLPGRRRAQWKHYELESDCFKRKNLLARRPVYLVCKHDIHSYYRGPILHV